MIKLLPSLGVVAALSFTLFAFAAENAPVKKDPSSPRYKLRVGQELNYAGDSDFAYEAGNMLAKITWKLLVVRQNPDGGWRLLVRNTISRGLKAKGGEEPTYRPESVTLAWCDVTPDGRVADNPTLDFSLDLRTILPQLPPPGTTRWQCENRLTTARDEYALLESDKADVDHIKIEDVARTPTDEIYLSAKKSTLWFDTKRGLIDRIESETSQGFGIDGLGVARLALVDIGRVDPNTALALALEMADYFAVKQEYSELVEQAGKEPAHMAELLAHGKAILDDLRGVTKTEIFQKQLDHDLKDHATNVKHTERDAERFGAVLGKPSPTWETTDLTGSTRSIEGCRGKVVVLDFWYRGCGWCIRAMPQVKQLAAHYQGQPVEIFGMNTDNDEADAHFVVDKLGLTYPTLKADGLPEKYGVRGFPTLVIIDAAGVVRDFHVGYSPTLAKSVIASVDKLLAETQPPR